MRCSSPRIRIQQVISAPVSAEMARPEETAENLCYKGSRGRRSCGSHRGRAGMLSYGHSPLSPTAWFSGKPPWDAQLSFPLLFVSSPLLVTLILFFPRLWARGMRSKYPQTRFWWQSQNIHIQHWLRVQSCFLSVQNIHWTQERYLDFSLVTRSKNLWSGLQRSLWIQNTTMPLTLWKPGPLPRLFCLMPAESVTLLPVKV